MLSGRSVTLVPLNAAFHSNELWDYIGGLQHASLWTWMGDGPYRDYPQFHAAIRAKEQSPDQQFLAILDQASKSALGYAAFLRDEPAHRVIEVGNIMFSKDLQRTRAATEAMHLMARHVFENLSYRRYEWKCNALNEPSRRAALRLGFTFEGIFRQHMIIKGLNRDTAWFSMLDSEWTERKHEIERWLDPSNFDEHGIQNSRLSLRSRPQ